MVTQEQWNAAPLDQISRARARKAEKLARVLFDHGATPSQVAGLPEYGWAMAEDLAHVRPASETTRALVVETLRVLKAVHGESEADVFGRL